MNIDDFKVGDKVQLKTWNEMVRDIGVQTRKSRLATTITFSLITYRNLKNSCTDLVFTIIYVSTRDNTMMLKNRYTNWIEPKQVKRIIKK